MLALSLGRGAQAMGGRVLAPCRQDIRGLSTDSRSLRKGQAFLALRGERFDGHAYLGQALGQGAAALVAERFSPALIQRARRQGRGLVQVADSLAGLQALAADQRQIWGGPVAAITGSNGKTGTKDALAHLLGLKGPVLATGGNFNNHVGLPLTLLSLERGHKSAALEMGMSHAGELALLSRLARPDVAVVTNVGIAHLGHFKSRAALAAAKAELVQGLRSGAAAALNGDDPRVRAMAGLKPGLRILLYGRGPQCALRLSQAKDRGAGGLKGLLLLDHPLLGKARARLALKRGGRPGAGSALAALAAGLWMGLDLRAMAARLEGWEPPARWRLQAEPLGRFAATALLDCYNASPDSMAAAFEYLALSAPKAPRLAALGDMLELGPSAPKLHRACGRAARRSGIWALAALGPMAEETCRGFGPNSAAFPAEGHAAAAAWIAERLAPGAWVLVKGSRGMRMERVAESLRG
jgi:UDP-N-acetylmuramoyl-tripeptide--D-alanyl-D-alanine ligase